MSSTDKVLKAGGFNTESNTGRVMILFMGFLDTVSAVIILALAVMGAQSLLQANIDYRVKLGAAILLVTLFAARLVERAFAAKR